MIRYACIAMVFLAILVSALLVMYPAAKVHAVMLAFGLALILASLTGKQHA